MTNLLIADYISHFYENYNTVVNFSNSNLIVYDDL
jgi:hypothetical protein